MIIRPACSGMALDEAMERIVEVKSLQELKEYILDVYDGTFNLDTLQCRFYCDDERIGWHTYLITADYANGDYKQQAVVFADSPMEDLPTVVVSWVATYKPPKRRFFIVKENDKGTAYLDTNLKWKSGTVQNVDDCKVFECPRSEIWEKVAWAKCLITDPNEKPTIYPVEVVPTSNGSNIFLRPLK